MSLDNLEKDLYSENDDHPFLNHQHDTDAFDLKNSLNVEGNPFVSEERWSQTKKGIDQEKKRKIIIGSAIGAGFVLIAAIFYGISWWKKNAFHQDRVGIAIEGPKEIDSTSPVKYVIHYKNDNYASIRNAEIYFDYERNFQPTQNINLKQLSDTSSKIFLGDIKAHGESSVELQGVFYAPKDYATSFKARIEFQAGNSNEKLSMNDMVSVRIANSPILLSVAGPSQAVSGDRVEYVIDYKNIDTRPLSDMQILVDFPSGFEMNSAQPMPSQNGIYWYVGSMETGVAGKIRIEGTLQGSNNEDKILKVSIGTMENGQNFAAYNSRDIKTTVIAPILSASLRLEQDEKTDVYRSGQVVRYAVDYKNIGDVGMRNVKITVKLDSAVLNYATLKLTSGVFDEKTRSVMWQSGDVPALATVNPGDGGTIRFSIQISDAIVANSEANKNFVVNASVRIESPDVPTQISSNKTINGNEVVLKILTNAAFKESVFYTDPQIKNSGPIPLQVGKKTTFSVHWKISSTSNDLNLVSVKSNLPSGVSFEAALSSDEKVVYNKEANEIAWIVGNVDAGAGYSKPVREAVFQISVIPQINQIGKPALLLNTASLSGIDGFTTTPLRIDIPSKNSELSEDASVGYSKSAVVAAE